jgi:hypothetical protein
MVHESPTARRIAVQFVTVLVNPTEVSAPTGPHSHSMRVQAMVDEAVRNGEMVAEDLLGALGLLAATAVEEVERLSGVPCALWLQRWLVDPFG